MYKLKVLELKLNEDSLQRRIYFLTFNLITPNDFSQYKENYMVLIDYSNIIVEDIKDHIRKAIMNILHSNIDVRSRRLIAELPGDVVKYISKIQSHCANMNFSEKSRYNRLFQNVTHKGE